mgnify:CR=1 FL=1
MKKNLTELVFILDKSGSMAGMEADTIGGFNSMIERQREERGETLVSTVLFNHFSTVIHDRVDLSAIRPLTSKEYRVGGNTALIDAIGSAIHHIVRVHHAENIRQFVIAFRHLGERAQVILQLP